MSIGFATSAGIRTGHGASIADFKKQTKPEYLMSTRGLSGGGTITGAITFAKMGVKWKPLNHNGQSEAVLVVLRGDADILWITYESAQQYLDSGDLRAVLYYDAKRYPPCRTPRSPRN